ncbi:hypothetical protein [Actinomadura rupiterrae]|uniref:hypothetical protein n=1 Tax=Actinomadura rupiterrae TaxID=559627 RepID=UPI0020A43D75|nr:hypothetical protein [Actinomadura rupiterrae]MCP2338229.1 hypothetical protein [Actinomadura rupiterrae]
MSGPYATENDAYIEVRDIYAAHGKRGVMQARTHDLLVSVCAQHDVELGEYDKAVLKWLARQPPETAQVIAGIIDRAAKAACEKG